MLRTGSLDDVVLTAQGRGEVYRLLALSFYEPTRELAERIADGSLASELSNQFGTLGIAGCEEHLAHIDRCCELLGCLAIDQLNTSLRREYTRLFIGPGRVPAPPYESIYRRDGPAHEHGLVMGRSTMKVRQHYAEAGLQLAPDFSDLPDHIGVELEYVYFLCIREAQAWQANDEEAAFRYQHAQSTFLLEHLAQWLPSFCKAVVDGAKMEFYSRLSTLAQAYVAAECKHMSMRAGLTDGGSDSSKAPAKVQ